MTPFQAWHGQKPGAKHLRIFGCAAYTHIPRDERGKLDSKSRRCVLLGYGSVQKGYRVFDPVTQKVLYSRNVVFNEGDVGMASLHEESTLHTFELESPVLDITEEESQIPPLSRSHLLEGLLERGDQLITMEYSKAI